MNADLQRIAMVFAFVMSGGGWFFLAFLNFPLYTGMMIADGPDPNRPGHLIAIMPSPLDVLTHLVLAVGGLWIGPRLRRGLALIPPASPGPRR